VIHFIVWIVISGIAGFIASKIVNKTGSGLLLDILLGILGGFLGGFIVSRVPALSGLAGAGGMRGLIVEAIVAIIGAALIIFLWNLVFRRRATA
jgi:uncharacterized membrane protein YeaQ/YmgE (transglycosylase-associated protein family)